MLVTNRRSCGRTLKVKGYAEFQDYDFSTYMVTDVSLPEPKQAVTREDGGTMGDAGVMGNLGVSPDCDETHHREGHCRLNSPWRAIFGLYDTADGKRCSING